MTGTLIKKKTSETREYFYINLSYKDPETKKWKTKTVSTGLEVKNNKRKAEKMSPDMINKYQYLEQPVWTRETANRDISLCDYLDIWLEDKKSEIKLSTYEGYAARVRSMKRYFEPKEMLLRDITSKDLDIYFKWCSKFGKVHQKTGEPQPLSPRSIRSYRGILSAMFDQAIIDGLIPSNPLLPVRVHGKKNREYADEMYFLTREEISDLLHFLEEENPRFTPIAFIAAYYGMRRSEILGLKWDAIDFDKHQITVQRTVVRVSTVEESETTKTPAGRRSLILFPTAEKCLRKVKAEQEENASFYGNTYKNTENYVFTWEDGRCYDPNYISRTFAKLTKKFGRPEITLHKLRHSCVSLLSEMGWELKKIQYWCGHSDFSTTANIYMHFNRSRLNQSADDLSIISEDCADIFEKTTEEKIDISA